MSRKQKVMQQSAAFIICFAVIATSIPPIVAHQPFIESEQHSTSSDTLLYTKSLGPLERTTSSPMVQFIPPTPPSGLQSVIDTSIPVYMSSSDPTHHYTLLDMNHDLMLWMQMDNTNSTSEGATIFDSSSYQYDGTAYGNAIQTDNGMFGKGYLFDGDEDYIRIDHQLITNKSFTMGGWINWHTIANDGSYWDGPIQFLEDGEYGWYIWADSYNLLYVYYYDHDEEEDWTSGYHIDTNTWYHVLLVQDTQQMSLYVNGNVIESCTAGDVAGDHMIIGGFPYNTGGGEGWFDGVIDDVVVFNRTLTDSEIKALYNAGTTQYQHTFTNLIPQNYTFTGYAVNTAGDTNQTDTRWRLLTNEPPSRPTNLEGPVQAPIGFNYNFSAIATDPEGLDLRYGWDWNNDFIVDEWTMPDASGETSVISHIWTETGTYTIRVKANDSHGLESDWSDPFTVIMTNDQPNKPSPIQGTMDGPIGYDYIFTTTASDPDNHQLRYGWDWDGDFIIDQWTEYSNSGETIETAHMYTTEQTYEIRVKANDSFGKTSEWSDPLLVTMTNDQPQMPEQLHGPHIANIGTEYTFSTTSTDPDDHLIQYGFDWNGDQIVDQWSGFYNSGDTIQFHHTFPNTGTYTIMVIARDFYTLNSTWSEPFTVNVIEANISIKRISGRLGKIQLKIENTCESEIEEVNWHIRIDGGLLLGKRETNDTIPSIAQGETVTIQSNRVLGLGRFVVTIIVEIPSLEIYETQYVEGFIFCFATFLKPRLPGGG